MSLIFWVDHVCLPYRFAHFSPVYTRKVGCDQGITCTGKRFNLPLRILRVVRRVEMMASLFSFVVVTPQT